MIQQSNKIRNQLEAWIGGWAMKLNLQDKDILEIGIAGDEKPSGNYKHFGEGNRWTTMDINPKWKPDIVADLTDNNIPTDSYDLIIMTQALEHIWDYKKALSELHRISRDMVIVDCPFDYPLHKDKARDTKDWKTWDDYWRFTPVAMDRLLTEVGFKKIELRFIEVNTLCLAKK